MKFSAHIPNLLALMSRVARAAPRAIPYLGLIAVLAFYAVLHKRAFTPAYAEPDPDGYVFMARSFAHGRLPLVRDPMPLQYHSHVWVETADGAVAPKFSPGFPLLMALSYRVFGEGGFFLASPILGGLALIGLFFLARMWAGPLAGVAASLTMAVHWYFLYYSGFVLTHIASLCFLTWGMYMLWRWQREPGSAWLGAAAGLLLGYCVVIRYTGAVFALPLIAVIARNLLRRDLRRTVWPATLAYGLTVLALVAYCQFLYGSPFSGGYGLSGESTAFSLKYFNLNYDTLLSGLIHKVFPGIFVIGLTAVALVGPGMERAMRILWLIPICAVYAGYYFFRDNCSYYRFYIPLIPLLIGSAYALIHHFPAHRLVRSAVIALFCAFQVAAASGHIRQAWRGYFSTEDARRIAAVAAKLDTLVRQDALIMARRPYADCIGAQRTYTLFDMAAFSRHHGRNEFTGNKIRPDGLLADEPLRQPRRTEKLRKFYEETSDGELAAMQSNIVVNAVGEGRDVVFIMPSRSAGDATRFLGTGFELRPLHKWNSGPRESWGIYRLGRARDGSGAPQ